MRLPMTDPSGEPRSTPLLIRIAVKSPDEEEAQAAVHALRLRGTREVLLAASRLCSSAHPRERIVGVLAESRGVFTSSAICSKDSRCLWIEGQISGQESTCAGSAGVQRLT